MSDAKTFTLFALLVATFSIFTGCPTYYEGALHPDFYQPIPGPADKMPLTVALMVDETVKSYHHPGGEMVDISLQPHVTNAVRKELENLFKGVTLVADRHEAKHEDLVALLKLTDNFGESYSIKLTFSDRQTQKPVVTFFSETSAPKMPEVVWMPHFANLARDVFVPGYEAATTKLVREISRNIQSDHRLAAFLEERNLMITAKSAPIVQQSTLSDEDRLSVTDPRGVQVIGKAPSAFVSEQFGKSWAVVIGIDDYEKAPRLKYAVADAKAMAGVLRQQGFQVTELYNRQASRRAIESELSDKLVDRVGDRKSVV